MKLNVSGIILNPFAHGGNSLSSFELFKTSTEFAELKMNQAKIFNCGHFQHLGQLKNELTLWLEDLGKNEAANIVCVGGDGMVHLLLNTMMNLPTDIRKNITIGAIGTGSSNDFHKPYLAVGRGKYKKIPYRLNFSQKQLVDVGVVEFHSPLEFKEYFIINASLGATALGNWFFNNPDLRLQKLKKISTGMAIAYATVWALKNFKAQKINLNFNDKKMEVAVCNLGLVKNPHFTGSLRYPEDPEWNDGSLYLYIAHSMNFFEMIALTLDLSKGKFTEGKKAIKEIIQHIHINIADKKEEFVMELDGEVFKTKSAEVSVLKQAVFICP